jgi:hypothetical protein
MENTQNYKKQILNDITINEIEVILRDYLETVHPKKSNGFIIRLSESIKNNYTKRKSYIVNFPENKSEDKFNVNNIVNEWSDYAINNIIDNYDLTSKYTIVSIDPISVDKNINKIIIQYSGETISPEELVKSVSLKIIEQMNVRLIEMYMDEFHSDIDIYDEAYADKLAEIYDDIDMESIYDKYKYVDVYVPIKTVISENVNDNIVFYLNGTIKVDSVITDIVDDIRMCLDFNDINERLEFIKEDIVYKFDTKNVLSKFTIITDPDI